MHAAHCARHSGRNRYVSFIWVHHYIPTSFIFKMATRHWWLGTTIFEPWLKNTHTNWIVNKNVRLVNPFINWRACSRSSVSYCRTFFLQYTVVVQMENMRIVVGFQLANLIKFLMITWCSKGKNYLLQGLHLSIKRVWQIYVLLALVSKLSTLLINPEFSIFVCKYTFRLKEFLIR